MIKRIFILFLIGTLSEINIISAASYSISAALSSTAATPSSTNYQLNGQLQPNFGGNLLSNSYILNLGIFTKLADETTTQTGETTTQKTTFRGGHGSRNASNWMLARKYNELVQAGEQMRTAAQQQKTIPLPTDPNKIIPALSPQYTEEESKTEELQPTHEAAPKTQPTKLQLITPKIQASILDSQKTKTTSQQAIQTIHTPTKTTTKQPTKPQTQKTDPTDKKPLFKLKDTQEKPKTPIKVSFTPDKKTTSNIEKAYGTTIIILLIIVLINVALLTFNFTLIRKYQMQKKQKPKKPIWEYIKKFFSYGLLITGSILLPTETHAVVTGPTTLNYEGTLMNSSGTPLTGSFDFRFSFWSDADALDTDGNAGFINTGSAQYLGWQESKSIALTTQGGFSIKIGEAVPFPDDLFNRSAMYLQVEVKVAGAAFETFEILDENPSNTTIDRMVFNAIPYAINTDKLDFRDAGYEAEQIPYLDEDAKLPSEIIPAGVEGDFSIGEGGVATGIISLVFGEGLAHSISWNTLLEKFQISDTVEIVGNLITSGTISTEDDVDITGTLTVTGTINGVSIGPTNQTIVLNTVYPKAIFNPDGTQNTGNMHEELENATNENRTYLRWETWKETLQDYDILVKFQLPENFMSFQTNAFSLDYTTEGTDTQAKIDITIEKDGEGGTDELDSAGQTLSSNIWTTTDFSLLPTTTWTAGDTAIIKIKTHAIKDYNTRVSDLKIHFVGS